MSLSQKEKALRFRALHEGPGAFVFTLTTRDLFQ